MKRIKRFIKRLIGREINLFKLKEIKSEILNKPNSENKINKNILIAPAVFSDPLLSNLHSLLGAALELRGTNVDYLICDKVLPACTNSIFSKINEELFIKEGPKKLCSSCLDNNESLFEQLSDNLIKLGKYLNDEDYNMVEDILINKTDDQLINFKDKGINIGEHCLAGTLRYYGIGNLSLRENGSKVLRSYFRSALLTKLSFEKILYQKKYDAVVVDHGLYVPQGILSEVAKQQKITTKIIWPGYKENSLLISDDITYHKSLITEDEKNWKFYNFNNEKKINIMNYLKARNFGINDWFSFNMKPNLDRKEFLKKYNIKNNILVSLMTNVIWDAQLKFEQNIFQSQIEWIETTINYFKDKKNVDLLIRVHPAEIRGDVPSGQKIKDEIYKIFQVLPENIKIIDANDKFSSYELSEMSNAVLVYATKLSFELPCFGQNVIVCGEAFAKNKGFTLDPHSKEQYLQYLDKIPFAGRLPKEKVNLAQKYAYHFFFRRCMEIKSIEKEENKYPPIKIREKFTENFLNGKDPGLSEACNSIIFDRTAILER